MKLYVQYMVSLRCKMKADTTRIKGILTVIAIVLSIPLIAMVFTSEVNWSFGDFLVAAGLLVTLGAFVEIAILIGKSPFYRLTLIAGAMVFFVLLWMELAVGIFGSPIAGS